MKYVWSAGAIALIIGISPFAAGCSARASESERGGELFAQQCALCHLNEGRGGQGPNLRGVFGRKAGTGEFSYTVALKSSGLVWDDRTLDRFLANPGAAVPGTSMAIAVANEKDRQAIIDYLKTQQNRQEAGRSVEPTARGDAFADWRADRPGLKRRITLADLPEPYATDSAGNPPRVVKRGSAIPKAPEGFAVELFAEGLHAPRQIKAAPNGDLFVAETAAGVVRVLRQGRNGKLDKNRTFVSGLRGPFGIAFYPPGPNPNFIYIAENNRIIRFAYREGDLEASAPAEVIVPELSQTSGGHVTRDIAFSPDGARMYVSVGSASNVAQGMGRKSPEELLAWEKNTALGAAWGFEERRANVLVFTPEGKGGRIFATGLRNCVGLAVEASSGTPYCSTNERDGLGDNLVPDYVTRVQGGAFYGWPWLYMNGREDPRWRGARPDLIGKVTMPDVLIQPHSAPLGMTFYDGAAFPGEYRGSAFVALHGSWNRAKRTGYKVVRILMRNGLPTGEYEDFLTGFVVSDDQVWGRPVGVATAPDGALFVSDDANGTIWRVTYTGRQ